MNEKNILIESLKDYITDVDNLKYAVVVVKKDQFSTLLYANSMYYELVGYTKEELQDKYQNHISEILLDKVYDVVKYNMKNGDYDIDLDLRLKTGSGGILWGHNCAHYNAKLDAFFITVTDITDKMVTSIVDLSFEAFQARNSILAYVSKYTSECVAVSDVETDEIIYMNPATMELAGMQNESDWQGKTFVDVAFGGKENAHPHYFNPLCEEFTSREYYNKFRDIYTYAKNKLIKIPNINRDLRLTIIKDVTAQKKLEQRILTRDVLGECVESLYQITAKNDSSETVYHDILKQLSEYYKSEGAFFYKLSNKTYQLEYVYRILNGKIEIPDLKFPIAVSDEQSELLKVVSDLSIEESKEAIHRFGELYKTSLEQFKISYKITNFSCVVVNDSQGEVVAFMGVTNPTANTDTKELMELLSRFVCMFMEHQKDQKIAEESISLENSSRAKIIEKCTKNFRNVAHAKENVVDTLESLCEHYGADCALVLYRNKNSDTYGLPYIGGSVIPDLSSFQNQPSYTMEKWEETFKKHSQFATDEDLDSPTAKMILEKQFGINNFIVAPLRDGNSELAGLLFITNYKLMNRSHLLAHGVAKYVADYIEKVDTEEKMQLHPSAITVNKSDIQNKISTMLKEKASGTLFIVDIDNFRNLNDKLGHHVGDVVLLELIDNLKQTFGDADVISRVGGDTFVVFSQRIVLSDSIEKKASQILSRCHHHYNKDGKSVAVSVSVGICAVNKKCKLYPALYENAEYALYIAKKSGKNCYHMFSETEYSKNISIADELRYLPNAVNAIKSALQDNSFVVHYQPLYNVPTGTYSHAEALVRMKKADGSLVYPNDFIEVAENTGLVVEITYQILEQVCRDFRNLLNENPNTMLKAIAINLPYLQFTDPRMESRFMEILDKYDIAPRQIKLEITERIVANDMDLILSKMESLKAKGFEFELDDFGTDYSNLKMCVSLPIDVIKLDRSLLLAAFKSEKDRRFFKHVIQGLHDSNRSTVMEGVETKEQLDWSNECDCDYIQGYYFSKPIDFDSLKDFLMLELPERMQLINPTNTSTNLMQLTPQAIVVINTKNQEITFVNSAGKRLFFSENPITLENLNNSMMHSVYDDAIIHEMREKGKSVLYHVCIKNADNIAERYDIHIAYVDGTRESVCLIFAMSELELERISHQSNYYRTVSDEIYSYPFHLDVRKKRMQFFKPVIDADYRMPMIIENFPDPLFNYNYICEEDIDEYKMAIERMYKGKSPKGSFRFYDEKGELLRYNVNYVVNRDIEGNPIEVNGDFIIQSEAQNTLEYKTALQETVHECMNIFFTVGTTDKDPKTAYVSVLNIVKEYYNAEGVYFYKLIPESGKVEMVHVAFDDRIKNLYQSLPKLVNEDELKIMQLLTDSRAVDLNGKLNSFGGDLEVLGNLQELYDIKGFASVGVNNMNGETIGYLGMINPKHHKGNKELMEMLRRPIAMFIEFQQEQILQQELLKLEANSKADVVKECVENFREFAHYKEHIANVLNSLCSHYDADCAVTLTCDKEKNGDYGISNIGGPKIPNLEGLQHHPAESMKKWEKTFQKHKHFVTDADIDNPTAKKVLEEQFGIYNYIASPIQDEHGVLTGLLYIVNYKTLNRSNLLAHIVANNISDYLDKISLYTEKHMEPLTRLTDKIATQNQISEYLESGRHGALFIIDIDNFKEVNDTLGHAVGDSVIVDIANEIKSIFRDTDIVGRVGGDEFMAFCPNPISKELVNIKAELICKRCKKTYEKFGVSAKVSASVGVLRIEESGSTFEDAYDKIDKALYIAKNNGRNQYKIYSDEDQNVL